jgi:dienelactone hydrolase
MKVHRLACMALLLAGPVFGQRLVSIPVVDPASGTTAQIAADLYGRGHRALVLVHGGRFDKESWRKQAPVFARAGFLVLAINLRGDRPNPDGTPGSFGSDEENATDVLAAVAYLHGIGVKRISAIGGSLGGDAVGNAEARTADGVFESMVFLGSEGGDHPEKLKGRKLYLVAREDANGEGPRLPGIRRHYEGAPKPRQLIVLEGSKHAQFLFDSAEGGELMRDLLRFLAHD